MNILWFIFAIGVTLPWLISWCFNIHFIPVITSFITGGSIVGAAFLLSWACEAIEKDLPRPLALTILALIAVLPEYAVDIYLAWMGGKNSSYISYAAANVTGANRLLIGIGWSLVIFLTYIKYKEKCVKLEASLVIELSCLFTATMYCFIIPIKENLCGIDSIFLLSLFIWYVIRLIKMEVEEPEIVGAATLIADLKKYVRIPISIFIFLFSGFCIYISAEPFVESLISIGEYFRISKFLLIQWVAPLASEAPEITVASIFILNRKASQGLGALIASKINQWTLLIGMLPLAFMISKGKVAIMPLDARQIEEILLTAAQSFFALSVLMNMNFSLKEASAIFCLFITQLVFPSTYIRYIYSFLYIILGIIVMVYNHKRIGIFIELFQKK
jgi:cation:H+ antiporter